MSEARTHGSQGDAAPARPGDDPAVRRSTSSPCERDPAEAGRVRAGPAPEAPRGKDAGQRKSSQQDAPERQPCACRLDAVSAQPQSEATHRATLRCATRHVSWYTFDIEIAHKGLLAFFERGDVRRIPPTLAPRIRRILSDLDAALQPGDMDLPGYRLHPLTSRRRGQWSVRVSAN